MLNGRGHENDERLNDMPELQGEAPGPASADVASCMPARPPVVASAGTTGVERSCSDRAPNFELNSPGNTSRRSYQTYPVPENPPWTTTAMGAHPVRSFSSYSRRGYSNLSLPELKDEVKRRLIKGTSQMNKRGLIMRLEEHDAEQPRRVRTIPLSVLIHAHSMMRLRVVPEHNYIRLDGKSYAWDDVLAAVRMHDQHATNGGSFQDPQIRISTGPGALLPPHGNGYPNGWSDVHRPVGTMNDHAPQPLPNEHAPRSSTNDHAPLPLHTASDDTGPSQTAEGSIADKGKGKPADEPTNERSASCFPRLCNIIFYNEDLRHRLLSELQPTPEEGDTVTDGANTFWDDVAERTRDPNCDAGALPKCTHQQTRLAQIDVKHAEPSNIQGSHAKALFYNFLHLYNNARRKYMKSGRMEADFWDFVKGNVGVYYLHLMLESFTEMKQLAALQTDDSTGIEIGPFDEGSSADDKAPQRENTYVPRRRKRKRCAQPSPSPLVNLSEAEEREMEHHTNVLKKQEEYLDEQKVLVATRVETAKFEAQQRQNDLLKTFQNNLESEKTASEPDQEWIEFLQKKIRELKQAIMNS